MLRGMFSTVLVIIALIGATWMVSDWWYKYDMLDSGTCAMFRDGTFGISPGHVVPNQPNPCYIRTPRLHLP